MFYELGAVKQALVAAGYEPRLSDGHFLVVLTSDNAIDTVFELHVEPKGITCRITLRYLRRLHDGAREQQAIIAKAKSLGMTQTPDNTGYFIGWGYAENKNSAMVSVGTYVSNDESIAGAISRLLKYASELFGQLESAGRITH